MMCKEPNKSKITTFLRQCLTSTSAKADLSALYSPSDLSVEQVELEDMRIGAISIIRVRGKEFRKQSFCLRTCTGRTSRLHKSIMCRTVVLPLYSFHCLIRTVLEVNLFDNNAVISYSDAM